MKAAIIGHGKMGREIEKILLERGHRIGAVIDEANASELDAAHLAGIDVALEFTTPDAAYGNIRACIDAGIPVVSGTTGWTNRLEELRSYCREKGGALFYASNYCLGVNLMFRLNRRLARMMERFDAYDVRIEEIHHTQKKDAPSGTAITLAEGIIAELDANAAAEELLRICAEYPDVTLLYAAKDPQVNHALVLRDYLEDATAAK